MTAQNDWPMLPMHMAPRDGTQIKLRVRVNRSGGSEVWAASYYPQKRAWIAADSDVTGLVILPPDPLGWFPIAEPSGPYVEVTKR